MKFQDGSNRFRILGNAIVGYMYWTRDTKPKRLKERPRGIPEDIKWEVNKETGNEEPTSVKHFWAFPVYDYAGHSVKVLEITQSTIQKGMKIKMDNRKAPATEYDWIVTRSGSGLLTEYDIDVDTKDEILNESEILAEAAKIDLEALFSGGDPFTTTQLNSQPEPVLDTTGHTQATGQEEDIDVSDIPF
jgi:hypothetical protein